MKIGDKIKILREIRGIAPKEMADKLEMTPAGYLKIERNEVDINTEKIEKISTMLGIKPHELLIDDKIVLNFSNNEFASGSFSGVNHINFPEDLKQLYQDKIRLLEERIKYLEGKAKS